MPDLPPKQSAPKSVARYIMIGGFLGAGKTTAIARLGAWSRDRGLRVGLITNDQGSGLVDTALLRSRGFDTEEIPGGCFCCRFQSLMDAAERLTKARRPEVFVAEPVGSCTDLVATVTYPLRRIYGDQFTVAPLSVLVDPVRAARVLGISRGASFSDKVRYIYKKQLEEADLIVVNKCDQFAEADRDRLRAALKEAYPKAEILEVSARTGDGLEAWFERLLHDRQGTRDVMNVDYRLYGEGEALLGWLNASLRIQSTRAFDGNQALTELAARLQNRLQDLGSEIAHLKMTFTPENSLGEIAVVNLVRNDFVPELSQTLEEPVSAGELILNLRAEADPEKLSHAVKEICQPTEERSGTATWSLEHLEAFRPGQPDPLHRDAVAP